MMKKLLLFVMIIFTGCATAPLTEAEQFEREYKYAQLHDEWLFCRAVVRNSGGIWWSTFHITRAMEAGRERPSKLDMNFDMGKNHCHFILKQVGYK
jgi:hypothetical protein